MLLGLQLVVNAPPHTLHFKWLHQLLERMPESIPVEFVSHSLASDQVMAQRGMLPLLENVMGKLGGPTGRLELLNLSSCVELTKLGAVCSLIPHSRSIVEVQFKVQSPLGLLWIAYAMFHPSSRQTKWTRLCVDDQCADATELQVLRRFLGSRNGPKVIQCVSTKMAQGECPAAPGQTERSEVPGEYVIQTAILSKRTDVYAANEPRGFRRAARNNEKKSRVDSRAMGLERFLSQMINRGNVEAANDPPVSRLPLAILPKDTQVELAEDDTTDLPESVHVIVPGCGLGIVPKAHLKEITTHQFPGRRASCITALSYEASVGDGTVATKIVRELLVDVRDVRVYPPLAFSEGSVPHDNVIESIDCYQFTAESSEWMQRLNRLHSLGLSCTSDQLHQLLSAIQSALTARPLRALRLTVDVLDSSNGDWKQSLASLSTAIGGKLKRLQVFEIGFRHRGALPDLDVEMDQFKSQLPPVHPSLAIGKLTFLWALRTWRPQCTAALDSYVIATIFAYCGRSMTRVVITRLPLGMRFSLAPRNQVV